MRLPDTVLKANTERCNAPLAARRVVVGQDMDRLHVGLEIWISAPSRILPCEANPPFNEIVYSIVVYTASPCVAP